MDDAELLTECVLRIRLWRRSKRDRGREDDKLKALYECDRRGRRDIAAAAVEAAKKPEGE